MSVVGRLVDATRDLADAVDTVDAARLRSDAEIQAAVGDLRSAVASSAERIEAAEARLAAADGQTAELNGQVAALGEQVADLRAEVSALREERDFFATRLQALQRREATTPDTVGRVEPVPPDDSSEPRDDVLDAADYLEFERRFRGSREEILERQSGTLELVRDALRDLAGPLLDVGCGRGEWLEVLQAAGVSAYGVDNNPEMAAAAQEKGLDVRVADGLGHLAVVAPKSLGAVSAFHLAEHLPLPVLRRMLDEAYDALADGGALLLETPDPTNLAVGAAQFYLDPTHVRPLHPLLLKFFVEIHGFVDVRVLRFHPMSPELVVPVAGDDATYPDQATVAVLSQMVFGPQDYLVVARRPAGAACEPDDDATGTSENFASA
jgi:O-antigen chain-terminating methyltransferase